MLFIDRGSVRSQISAPIVVAPLTAAVLGLPWLGLLTGLLFQLFWMNPPKEVKFFQPNAGFGAIIASALSSSLVGPLAVGERLFSLWPFSILFGFLVSPLFGIGPWLASQFIQQKILNIDSSLTNKGNTSVNSLPIVALFISGLSGGFIIGVCYCCGYFLWSKFQLIWYEADPILLTIVPLFAGVGLANVAKIFVSRDTIFAFILGAGIMMVFELYQRF